MLSRKRISSSVSVVSGAGRSAVKVDIGKCLP
jgi:hypothetical protein